ncbi:MAG: prenyltransferase [Holophagaceae bacterium]|nr:prenyltransferase [Holophagaceae bacterium]
MTKHTFTARKIFGAIFGQSAMPYLLHLRPLEWPIMSAHFLLGTFLAVGFEIPWREVILGWFIFVILMNGGTLAINSAFDKDDGDIGYLKSPPRTPKYLLHVSTAMLVTAFLLGYLLPPVFALATAVCVLMSVLYSVPPARLKARAGWDLLINMLGYGLLTPIAGWGLTGQPLTPWFWKICIGFGFLFGAIYPATQIYQIEEDAARGDKTMVIKLGVVKSLGLAWLLALVAHAMFFWAAVNQNASERWVYLSFLPWNAGFAGWIGGSRSATQDQHEKMMYWFLACWAVTDIAILCSLWP